MTEDLVRLIGHCGSWTLHPDGTMTWKPNPHLDMTPAEQWRHAVTARELTSNTNGQRQACLRVQDGA